MENYEGYAEELLKNLRFGPHDAFIIVSTSGVRPLIVEMAKGVQSHGMPIVGFLSKEHSEHTHAGHSSGKKLVDLADIVLDNQCPPGDYIIELDGLEWRTGPISTVTGAMIINMLRVEIAEQLLARGIRPETMPSHQIVGSTNAEEQLDCFYEAYRRSLAHLYTT